MLHKSIVKELEKNGFLVEHDLSNKKSLNRFLCRNTKNIMTWWDTEDGVHFIHVKGIEEESDIYTDYFPGTFFHSIKSALNSFKN